MKKLIIDGNNLIHRTYWVAKNVSKRSAADSIELLDNFHIHTTLNAVISYVNTYNPTDTYVVWDARRGDKSNTRKDIFDEYKGNRSTDSSPHRNNDTIQFLLEKLGIKSIFPFNLEADDIVAHICTLPGNNVIISVDKDFLQLVNDHTVLFDPIRKKEYNINNFEEMTGCKDTVQWMHEKCLLGDKSDNVPGAITKSKLKKLNENKYTLTDEEKQIYERNKQLFSLSHDIESKHVDISFYTEQLNKPCDKDWQVFVDECTKRNFTSILKKKSEIYSSFFLASRLLSFFAKE